MKRCENKLKYNKKKLFEVLIPVIIAVLVVSGFAISGYVTKNLDGENPTAPPTTEEATEEPSSQAPVNAKVTLVAVGDNLIHNTMITAISAAEISAFIFL